MLKGILSVALALASVAGSAPAAERRPVIAIQPYGKIDAAVVARVEAGVRDRFDADVVVLAARELPADAFYAPRRRYKADKLLVALDAESAGRYTRIVGLTDRDISTSTDEFADWGVYGLSEFSGESGVVSTFRLARGAAGAEALDARVVKAVDHELGHTFGAEHCPVAGCVMADAEGSIRSVDAGDGRFCPVCLARLGAIARRDAPAPTGDTVATAKPTADSSRTPYAEPGRPAAPQKAGGL